MAVDAKLLEKAQNSPQSLRFEEAVKFAEQLGWEEIGGSDSHKVFRHPDAKTI
jgi:predicted RNA binding protein YcfA (HicA-like mRNA interferase family)